jgi:hypothetical protein
MPKNKSELDQYIIQLKQVNLALITQMLLVDQLDFS